MNIRQKEIWKKTLTDTQDNKYDFIYFIDILDSNNIFSKLLDNELNEFRTDSRYLMKEWLKSVGAII